MLFMTYALLSVEQTTKHSGTCRLLPVDHRLLPVLTMLLRTYALLPVEQTTKHSGTRTLVLVVMMRA